MYSKSKCITDPLAKLADESDSESKPRNSEPVYVIRCPKLVCVLPTRWIPTTITYKHMSVLKTLIIILDVVLWVSLCLMRYDIGQLNYFQLFGWTIMGIGIWLRVDPKSYEPSRFIDTDNMIHASLIMIITGFIIIIIGFVGLIGTVTGNPCLLATVRIPFSLFLLLFTVFSTCSSSQC